MAKKKINILLIIVVLGLWGTVGFRTINRYFGVNDAMAINSQMQNREVSLKKINKDTFELEKITRDPFLNKQFSENKIVPTISYHAPAKKVIKPTPSIPKPKFDVPWPQLQYFGYIKSNNLELVLLKIDSKLHKLKLNDEVNGLIVKKKYNDSLEVVFNSQSRIIHTKKN